MNRPLIFLAASMCAAVAVTSACYAKAHQPGIDASNIRFTAEAGQQPGEIQLSLRSGRDNGNFSHGFGTGELAGLDRAVLDSGRAGPVRFTLTRDAGRIDCDGQAAARRATGTCRFTADAAFGDYLAKNGMPRPTVDESYGLAVTGATRDLVDGLVQAKYAVDDVDDLMGLAAVGVTRGYIADLAGRGYRPDDTSDLVAFGALKISPAYIDAMSRSGYPRLDADAIVQFKALDISPDYIRALASAGYPNLSSDDIAGMKAVGVTPEFMAKFRQAGFANLKSDELIQLKIFNVDTKDLEQLRREGVPVTAEALVERKIFGGHRPGRGRDRD
ncbi:MAG TPA: hypothetical protein VHM21_08215 [Sphingomicrobium sp.]|nr:hypothetical protein [Sphingomicrobium sp.]